MKTTDQLNEKIDRLLSALDTDARHLRKALARLVELSELIIEHDETSMEHLLRAIRIDSDAHLANEYARQVLRKELAGIFNVEFDQLTLVKISEFVVNPRKHRLLEKRVELKNLAADLKVQFQATAMLIKECARLNTLLLNSLMNFSTDRNVTYNANGYTSRETNNAFMNYHL